MLQEVLPRLVAGYLQALEAELPWRWQLPWGCPSPCICTPHESMVYKSDFTMAVILQWRTTFSRPLPSSTAISVLSVVPRVVYLLTECSDA